MVDLLHQMICAGIRWIEVCEAEALRFPMVPPARAPPPFFYTHVDILSGNSVHVVLEELGRLAPEQLTQILTYADKARQSDAVLLGQGTAATLGHLSDIAHGVGVTGVFTTSDAFVSDNVELVAHLRETERYMKQNVNEEVGVLELLIWSSFSLPAHIHGLVTALAGRPMATARPRFKT